MIQEEREKLQDKLESALETVNLTLQNERTGNKQNSYLRKNILKNMIK